jgi:hypothetical protein
LETIGGQYPFIFRNGNVKYKEFSIGGLISYLMDEKEAFLTTEEKKNFNPGNQSDKEHLKLYTTNLTEDNIYLEK